MRLTSSLTHHPKPRWEFDESVVECFPDMLARSVPDYHVMRRLCRQLAGKFIQPSSWVIDLGASLGEGTFHAALEALEAPDGAEVDYVMVENSKPMLERLRSDVEMLRNAERYHVQDIDLASVGDLPNAIRAQQLAEGRKTFERGQASVVLCVLTLMFLPPERRGAVLRGIYDSLADGGVLILVEKVLGSTYDADRAFVELHERHKREIGGYTAEQIAEKKASLRDVLIPMTSEWTVGRLRGAGFGTADVFWRSLNFCGWLVVK